MSDKKDIMWLNQEPSGTTDEHGNHVLVLPPSTPDVVRMPASLPVYGSQVLRVLESARHPCARCRKPAIAWLLEHEIVISICHEHTSPYAFCHLK